MSEEKLMEKIKDITREAGEIMLTAVHPKVMEKGGHANFVTETDEKIRRKEAANMHKRRMPRILDPFAKEGEA